MEMKMKINKTILIIANYLYFGEIYGLIEGGRWQYGYQIWNKIKNVFKKTKSYNKCK